MASTPPAVPVRPARPGTVTVAVYLQLALVGLLLAVVGLAVAHALHYDELIDGAVHAADADPATVSNERAHNTMETVLIGGPVLLLAAWFGACAVPLYRGSNVARILTLVAGGLELVACCVPAGAMFGLIPVMVAVEEARSDEDWAGEPLNQEENSWGEESAFYDALSAGENEWFFALGALAMLVAFALCIAIMVLLLTPATNRYVDPRPDPFTGAWPIPTHGYPIGHPYPTYVYPADPYPPHPGPVPPPANPAAAQPESAGPTVADPPNPPAP
ncbi:MAG TPA: hypothetical protein VFX60_13060 [Micromonospora sp.]|nr:hypothetical protein [Micromonospora sp.]